MEPHLKMNKMFLLVLGHWPGSPSRNRVIRTLTMIAIALLYSPVLVATYKARNDFNDFLICIPMGATGVLYYISFGFFISKTHTIGYLWDRISQDFIGIEPYENEIKILRKSSEEGRSAILIYMVYIGVSIILYCLVSLTPVFLNIILPLNESRPKVYLAEMDYIFFDKDNYYNIIFIKTFMIGTYGMYTITSCDMMLYTYIQHACGMFCVLRYRLQNILQKSNNDQKLYGNRDEREMYKDAATCVFMHYNILEFVENLDSCFSTFLFCSYGWIIVMMVFQGAMLVIKIDTFDLVFRYGTYYCAQIIHLLFTSIPGQMLVDHSTNLMDDLYDADWHAMPPRIQRVLLLMMVRSLRESKVTIGKLGNLSMETYSSVLRTIFSYLSVLTSMQD